MPAAKEFTMLSRSFRTYRAIRKLETLRLFAETGQQYGVSTHEIRQWAHLYRAHGFEGLRAGIPLYMYLDIPRTEVVLFESTRFTKMAQFVPRLPESLQQIIPSNLRSHSALLYLLIRMHTTVYGICTYADIVHILWPNSSSTANSRCINVYLFNLTTKLDPVVDRIEAVPGRGVRLVRCT